MKGMKKGKHKIEVIGVKHAIHTLEDYDLLVSLKKHLNSELKLSKGDAVAIELGRDEIEAFRLLSKYFEDPKGFRLPSLKNWRPAVRKGFGKIMEELISTGRTTKSREPDYLFGPSDIFFMELISFLDKKGVRIIPVESTPSLTMPSRLPKGDPRRELVSVPIRERKFLKRILEHMRKGLKPKAVIAGSVHAEEIARMLIQHGIDARPFIMSRPLEHTMKLAKKAREVYRKREIKRRLERRRKRPIKRKLPL
jgi:hypothetical protein